MVSSVALEEADVLALLADDPDADADFDEAVVPLPHAAIGTTSAAAIARLSNVFIRFFIFFPPLLEASL